MELKDLKARLVPALKEWAVKRIDAFAAANPKMKTASFYMKRGVENILDRKREHIGGFVDNISMFFCDKDGKFNEVTLFNDAMALFSEMEETPFEFGFIRCTAGNGIIRIHLPENPLTALLFGDSGAIKITKEDIAELKNALFGVPAPITATT